MMSEVSFSSTLDAATPMGKSRRISILPISHADLSSPTTARKQLHLLELDNVALSSELNERDEQVQALQSELELLRCKVASSSTSTSDHTPLLSSSTSTDSIDAGAERSYSAEVKAAKRLLHRLIAQIVAYDSADEPDVNLDQSLVHDPERSVVAPSSTHLTTPNGKTRVARRFEGDLVDDVETLASVLKEFAAKTSFAADEQSLVLKSVTASNEKLSTRIQELESELEQAHTASSSNSDKDAIIEQLRFDLSAAQQRESHSKTELELTQPTLSTTQAQLKQMEAKLDQITAEQELTISAAAKKSAAQIEALKLQLEEQQEQSHASCSCSDTPVDDGATSKRTTQLEGELEQVNAERDAAAQESHLRISALEAQLEERRTKASDLQSIFSELQEKKQRLHTIQLHTTHIRSLEKVVVMQERIVGLLDRQSDTGSDGEGWMTYARELSASLAQLKSTAPTRDEVKERHEAAVATDAVEAAPVDNGLVDQLKDTIDELEARILRRNEQIGSLQRQLHNVENDLARTRTNQLLAEETVVDLDAEKLEHLSSIKQLEERVAQLESSASPPQASSGTAEEVHASLASAQQRIAELCGEVQRLTEERDASQTEKRALESAIEELREKVQQLESSRATAQEAELQQEAELTTIKASLSKTEDRLASNLGEMDALQLSLAELRESASADRERIDSLQTQLAEMESTNAQLAASSVTDRQTIDSTQTFIAELTSKIALLENQAVLNSERHSELQTQLTDLQERKTELERVLDERDVAIRSRNEEYWMLKEELAELQEEAERSRPDMAALTDVQTQLEEATKTKSQLEDRICAQETALLKLKSELTSARSTEELLNEQYTASQRRVHDLESVVSQLERSPASPTVDAAHVEALTAKVSSLEGEVAYLSERIEELETDLGRKADEIEEADSKILDALKESKKYATRYTKLSTRYEALQAEAERSRQTLRGLEAELEAERAKASALKRKEADAGVVRSGSGGVAGRKRAKPDTDEAPEGQVKAVYAPSPTRTPSSFTPVRRSTKPLRHHTPVDLGHGTPPTTTSTAGGMVRSTSNPSQLIADRLASPAKDKLLSDKTNLTSAGSSRLSSKVGGADAVKRVMTMLPDAGERRSGGERKVTGGAAGGGGAADFLARMKAQRAASQRA